MKWIENNRRMLFTIILIIFCCCSVAYTVELRNVLRPVENMADNVEQVNIDQSDFTPIVKLGAVMTEGIVGFISTIVYVIFVFLGNVIGFLIFSLLAVRKTSLVTEDEVKNTFKIIWSFVATAFVICLCITKFDCWLEQFFLFVPIPLFAFLFYYLKLKKQYEQGNMKNEE